MICKGRGALMAMQAEDGIVGVGEAVVGGGGGVATPLVDGALGDC